MRRAAFGLGAEAAADFVQDPLDGVVIHVVDVFSQHVCQFRRRRTEAGGIDGDARVRQFGQAFEFLGLVPFQFEVS